jgi:hypothetical protein
LIQIRDLGVSHLTLTQIPPSRIKALSRIALTVRAQTMEKMPFERKMATLLAFAKEIEATAQDEILDVLEGLVKELLAKSARNGKKERLRTLKDLDQQGLEVRLEDRERLSPLGHIHINMLGRFFFDLPESVHLGAMRALRSISDFNEKFT